MHKNFQFDVKLQTQLVISKLLINVTKRDNTKSILSDCAKKKKSSKPLRLLSASHLALTRHPQVKALSLPWQQQDLPPPSTFPTPNIANNQTLFYLFFFLPGDSSVYSKHRQKVALSPPYQKRQ